MKKREQRPLSINTLLAAVFSLIITVMVIFVGTAVIFVMEKSVINTSMDSSTQLVTLAEFTLNRYFQGINSSLQNLAQNDFLVEMCKYSEGETDSDNIENRKEVQNQISGLLSNQSDISNIIVLGDGFSVYHSDVNNAPLMKSELIQELLALKETQRYASVTYHPISPPTYYASSSPELEIPVSLMVRDFSTYDTTNYGIVLASLSLRPLNDFFQQMDSESGLTAFIVDSSGKIFYSSDSRWINGDYSSFLDTRGIADKEGKFLLGGSGERVLLEDSRELSLNDWSVILTSDMSALNSYISSIRRIVFLCAGIAFMLTLVLSWLLTRRITAPLAKLLLQMEVLNFDSVPPQISTNFSYKEVDQLYSGYNRMTTRINTLINEVYYEQLRQKDAQYEALQAKINPHFLYNTLQTISSLAILERNDDIEVVTNALGSMLEYLTYEKDSQVYLADELDYIKSFIQIQLLRYNNRFIAGYEIAPETLSCRINKLLLQPIVENAIKHGFEQKPSGGRLYLRTRLEGGLLIIEVEDNGAGMDKQTLEALIQKTNNPDKSSPQKSIGLSNVQERIHLKYGEQYGIVIQSTLGKGTFIMVTIPAVFNDEKEGTDDETDFTG